jgi:hypothetical protein
MLRDILKTKQTQRAKKPQKGISTVPSFKKNGKNIVDTPNGECDDGLDEFSRGVL